MLHQTICLREDDPSVTLTAYVQNDAHTARDAILVIPGGGYCGLAEDREGEPIAMAFASRGVNAFVLLYSVGERAKFPRPLADASLAMAYIKDHAEAFHINPERVFCVGFSAGGHLAASLGTLWHQPEAVEMAGIPFGKNKPAGMILCYPVLTSSEYGHLGSFYQILGTREPTEEQLALYSIEKHVDERTVPAFLLHTANDPVVPVENTLVMAMALSRANIPFEVHIYPDGPHGIALADWQTEWLLNGWKDAAAARWIDDAVCWMKKIGSLG